MAHNWLWKSQQIGRGVVNSNIQLHYVFLMLPITHRGIQGCCCNIKQHQLMPRKIYITC